MRHNNFIKILAFALFTISIACFLFMEKSGQLVDMKEVQAYMKENFSKVDQRVNFNKARLDFWEKKLKTQPQSSIYKMQVAQLLSERFKINGNINDIHRSDSLLESVLPSKTIRKAPYYRALSANAITRHQFKQAHEYATESLESARHPDQSHLMQFDALLELGKSQQAKAVFDKIKTKNSFDYMIRKARLQDHDGKLNEAIITMEEVAEWCREREKKQLLCWTMSNLGDMYGHADRIKDAYQAYLDVLTIDSSYHYALKGIAWIAFSHDKNPEAARSITKYLLERQSSPDLYLLLAEIEAFEGNTERAAQWENKFIATTSQPAYGQMYHRYLAEIYLDKPSAMNKSQYYIEKELANRPSASSYALLAQYYLKQGNKQKALETIEERVEGKTFEPDVLYQIGLVYKEAGLVNKARKYLNEAATASFELGPLTSKKIQSSLSELKG